MPRCRAGCGVGCAGTWREFDVVILFDVYSSERARRLGGRPGWRCRTSCRRTERFRRRWSADVRPSSGRSSRCGRGERFARRRRVSTCRSPSVVNTSRKALIPRVSIRSLPPLDIASPDGVPRSSEPSVVYLGRLAPIKRIDVLLEAFARVRAELPDATLEVIGAPTPYGDEMRARAGEGVSFRGLIPEEQKSGALASSRVFASAVCERGAAGRPSGSSDLWHSGRALGRLRPARGGRGCGNRLRRQCGRGRRCAAASFCATRAGAPPGRGGTDVRGRLPAGERGARSWWRCSSGSLTRPTALRSAPAIRSASKSARASGGGGAGGAASRRSMAAAIAAGS